MSREFAEPQRRPLTNLRTPPPQTEPPPNGVQNSTTRTKTEHTAAAVGITRLLLCGDLLLYRAGLRILVEQRENLRVVGEAKLSPEALEEALKEYEADLVILDFDLILSSDTDLQKLDALLGAASPKTTLILTSGVEGEAVKRAVASGVTGIVFKCNTSDVLLEAIDRARSGQTWIDRMVLSHIVGDTTHSKKQTCAEQKKIEELTAREREIIRVVCEGLSNRQVAERLHITEATVRHHLSSIFWKLRLSTRSELIVYAYRHELASLPTRSVAS